MMIILMINELLIVDLHQTLQNIQKSIAFEKIKNIKKDEMKNLFLKNWMNVKMTLFYVFYFLSSNWV